MATLTAYADTDGSVYCVGSTYSQVRNGAGGNSSLTADTGTVLVGQDLSGGFYAVFESFFRFDTSSLGAGSTISSAVLSLYGKSDSSTTDFVIEVRASTYTSIATGTYVAGASISGTILTSYNTSGGWTTSGYNTIGSITSPNSNVSKTGATKFQLTSERTRTNTAPSGAEYVNAFPSSESGTSKDPKLVITYTPAFVPPKGRPVRLPYLRR